MVSDQGTASTMGNALCCCPDPDPGPASADRPLKFLDSAGGKSNTGGGSSAPSAAATPDWPAPDSAPQPPDSAPNSQGAVTTTLERWLAFLEAHPEVRGITGDTWNMFLHFADTAGRDLSTYDDAEAWPSLFDDFVEFENDQTNQNVPPHPLKGPPDEVKAD
ncbi:hypothetical protein IscW_ISCW018970 [Ixodes scapularis]|uniref:Defective in cullin neddylation protein n=1 Tax=Ixodes scapularis TaxID=6945 RepID=B7PM99_IXOSC|nr:hypothetical protein IscW_ISCW018970 [Ixodes scapularis]|eukprot:XP_002434897.1 hypothetical protein IscW_ISCW018970 [Ixodes scapularis]